MRKVLYISGTRADFGLMQSTLQLLHGDADIDLGIIATGMHLDNAYGNTVEDIIAAGLKVVARVSTILKPTTGATMARATGTMISAFADILETENPDIVLLLGDRGEMLAGAIAAIHLNIPLAHIHGGERSGTVDEPVRHAISKLSHIHFSATENSAERLIAMGENRDHVFVTGAPGLDGLEASATLSKEKLWTAHALDRQKPTALFLFHPVLQEAESAGEQATQLLASLLEGGWQVVALMPNADAGSTGIRKVLDDTNHPALRKLVHLPRPEFIGFMKAVDVITGNSSAGIIEAASFGTPVINIGNRQALRERNVNVVDVSPERDKLAAALAEIQGRERLLPQNIYGDGHAGERICKFLKSVDIGPALMNKVMTY